MKRAIWILFGALVLAACGQALVDTVDLAGVDASVPRDLAGVDGGPRD